MKKFILIHQVSVSFAVGIVIVNGIRVKMHILGKAE